MRVGVENFPIYVFCRETYRDFVGGCWCVLNTVAVNLQTLLNIYAHIWAPLSRGPQLDYLLLQFITIATRILQTAKFIARFVSILEFI